MAFIGGALGFAGALNFMTGAELVIDGGYTACSHARPETGQAANSVPRGE